MRRSSRSSRWSTSMKHAVRATARDVVPDSKPVTESHGHAGHQLPVGRGARQTCGDGDIEDQRAAHVAIECHEALCLRRGSALHETRHLAGDAEPFVERMRSGDRPSALPRSLSLVDRAKSGSRGIDVNMHSRVIKTGNGIESPIRPAAADRRARGRQSHTQFHPERKVVIDG